jgi:hypothetical protein
MYNVEFFITYFNYMLQEVTYKPKLYYDRSLPQHLRFLIRQEPNHLFTARLKKA